MKTSELKKECKIEKMNFKWQDCEVVRCGLCNHIFVNETYEFNLSIANFCPNCGVKISCGERCKQSHKIKSLICPHYKKENKQYGR